MFGYIIINKAEMKFKEFDIYHSFYCGICRDLKRKYGACGQIALSYDMTFLAMLLTGLYEPETRIGSCKCIAHPFEKHGTRNNVFTEYTADMNALFTWYKCCDDWKDERKVWKLIYGRILEGKTGKLRENYGEKVKKISLLMQKFTEAEQAEEADIDTLAGLFGQVMAQIVTPKEVVFEDGRELRFPDGQERPRFYVYGPYGVSGIFFSPARAVNLAYDMAGVVVDYTGERIWMRGNRHTRNQIMAIKEVSAGEEKSSVAACLDTIFQYEGLARNSEYLLAQGQSVREILADNLENAQILDMAGCNLDSVLYYVDQDIPVMAMLENGEAVLITGFNELNVLILEPSADPAMYRKGINDSSQWFEENGNCFITYVKDK